MAIGSFHIFRHTPCSTRLTIEEKTQIRALNDAGLCRRANGRKIGRTHFLISTYLRNSDGFNKKKDNRCETFCSSRREADIQANVQQLLVSQQGPSRTEIYCLGEHRLESAPPQRKCCFRDCEEGSTSDFSSQDGSARICLMEHDNRLEYGGGNFLHDCNTNGALGNAFRSSPQMSKSLVWMDLKA